MFISGDVTPGNDSCNLCRNGATKLRDKLQEKLPSVTAPYNFIFDHLMHVFTADTQNNTNNLE